MVEFTYQGNEVSFSQKRGWLSGPLGEVDGRGFELANALVVEDLLVGPLLVDVDLQVVPLKNGEAMSGELKLQFCGTQRNIKKL